VIDRLKNRLASEQGFTLIELLVVIIILGILVAIAVPAYLSFTQSAHQAAAESNVRSAVPAAEDYYETNGSYKLMTEALMAKLSPGIDPAVVATVNAAGDSYGLSDTSGTATYCYIGGADAATQANGGTVFAAPAGGCPAPA
jgi:type IV pilus assembly protein PilA